MNELKWVANYSGGKQFPQFDPKSGAENKYKDIDREKLERFDLLNKETGKAIHSVYLREGQILVYRRRTFIKVKTNERSIVYLVGWKMDIMTNSGVKTLTVINYIHPDGSIALDGARNSIEFLPEEL